MCSELFTLLIKTATEERKNISTLSLKTRRALNQNCSSFKYELWQRFEITGQVETQIWVTIFNYIASRNNHMLDILYSLFS
jgi:hypothetical protein